MRTSNDSHRIEPLAVSVEEAAQLLGIGRSLAYEAARRGELRTVRLGRRLLVPVAAIEHLLTETEAVPWLPKAGRR
jgi:excisionase family DNA binding protein